jgi:transcriptional regulator with XRE-family HTH domain
MTIDKDLLYQNIGEKIKQIRKLNNMSQEYLGELSGIKRAYVSQIEKGNKHAPLSVIYQICLALECDLMDLLPNINDVKQGNFDALEIKKIKFSLPKTGKLIEKLMKVKS